MADTRELIMARLVVVVGQVLGAANVARNELFLDDADDKVKRVSVLEGDELAADQEGSIPLASAPRAIYMQPQVLLVNFDAAGTVGKGLSASRVALIKAIAADSTLTGYTHKNSGGRYMGMESDFAFARDALGRMALKFQFTYVLVPSLI